MITEENFLKLAKTNSTAKSWRISLNKFFVFINTDSEKYLSKWDTNQDFENDVIGFARYLERTEHLAPKSIRSYVSGTVKFLKKNGIKMSEEFWKTELGVKNEALTVDDAPSREVLQSILSHTDVCGKALILLGSCSGLDPVDMLKLKLKTIQDLLQQKTPMFENTRSKTGTKHLVLLSGECVSSLKEWVKIRDEWLQWASKHCSDRGIGEMDIDSDRLFPFSYSKCVSMWNSALEDSGNTNKDGNTGRRTLHLKSLRKYFRTNLGRGGMLPDVAEGLMGHTAGLTAIYTRYTKDEIRGMYATAEPHLRVFVEVVQDPGTAHNIEVLRKKIEILEQALGNEIMKDLKKNPESKLVWKSELNF